MCPPFGPLPAFFVPNPLQHPGEWLILAGIALGLIGSWFLMRWTRISELPTERDRINALAALSLAFICWFFAFGDMLVILRPWSDASWALLDQRQAQEAFNAATRGCGDALFHGFFAELQQGEFTLYMIFGLLMLCGFSLFLYLSLVMRRVQRAAATTSVSTGIRHPRKR